MTSEQTVWGGALAAGGLGPDALRQNPAGLSGASPFQFAASHRSWQLGLRQEWLGARFAAGSTWLGVDAAAVHAGTLEGFDELGASTGSFQPLEVSVGIGAARSIFPFLDAGVAVHGLSLSGSASSLRSWSADCGVVAPMGRHQLGIALRHIGPPVAGELGEYRLPTELAAGGAHRLPSGLDAAWAVVFETDGSTGFRGGARWRPAGALALLAGGHWSTSDARMMPGAGVEVDWSSLRLSYGFAPDPETGATHHLAIAFRGSVARGPSLEPAAPVSAFERASKPEPPPAAATAQITTVDAPETWSVWGGTHHTRQSAEAEARSWKAAGVDGADLVPMPDGSFRVRIRSSLPRSEALRLAQAWGAHAAADLP